MIFKIIGWFVFGMLALAAMGIIAGNETPLKRLVGALVQFVCAAWVFVALITR